MSKRSRGKTETIKDRAIYVYLPSLEMVGDWKGRARKAGVSISRFVVEGVEDSIRREEGEEGYLSRLELVKRLRNAEEELKKLRNENRLLEKLVDNLDWKNEEANYWCQRIKRLILSRQLAFVYCRALISWYLGASESNCFSRLFKGFCN